MASLHIDFETRSYKILGGQKSDGLDNYCRDASTQVLMLAWAVDDEEVELWQPHLGPMPDRLRKKLESNVEIAAFNSPFERNILWRKLGMNLPAARFVDPQVSGRYLSLPSSLEAQGEILNLPKELQKDARGEALIKLFCEPVRKKKKGQPVEVYFNDWNSHPNEWAEFGEYCKQDVRAERELVRRMKAFKVFPMPPFERRLWLFDQKVNDLGLPVDRKFVENMLAIGTKAKEEAVKKQNEITGLENSNSNTQMLEWVRSQGYAKMSLNKNTVTSELKFNTNLTELCRKVLNERKIASSTSYKKMAALLRLVSPDNRLRNQFVFLGSSRCGRWSGSGYQFQNQARPAPEFEDPITLDEARLLITNKDYDGLIKRFGKTPDDHGAVLGTIKSCIRTSFVAPEGRRLNVCDLNAVETRGAAYIAQCQTLLDVFRSGQDVYLDFGVKLTGIPYEKLAVDIKSKDAAVKVAAKVIRQDSKVGVLACVYRISGGEIKTNQDGDQYKSGLWGYAEAAGNDMSQDRAHEIVRIYRESYPEIVQCWHDIENAIKDVLAEGTTRVKRAIGPNGCVKIDKLTRQNNYPILRIQLPSGRFLHYLDARVEEKLMPWKDQEGNPVYRPTVVYATQDQKTKKWSTTTSHGGKFFENIIQGFCRDVFAVKLLLFDEAGIEVCGHSHDEGIGETDDSAFEPGVEEMKVLMNRPVEWAPDFPLGSDGFEGNYYHK